MNSWTLFNLQDANSPNMESLTLFHDFILLTLILIVFLISYLFLSLSINKMSNKFINQNQTLEIIWTVIPMLMLIFLSLPSIKILYMMDETNLNTISIKSIGHQWYWSYEYSDFENINFDSFMIPTKQLKLNNFRLLDVDNNLILPFKNKIQLLTSSLDVIHSWTIPSIGIKMDSIPGRINQSSFYLNRPGLFYGQCSEICGMNHSFMPIVLESTTNQKFIKWLNTLNQNDSINDTPMSQKDLIMMNNMINMSEKILQCDSLMQEEFENK